MARNNTVTNGWAGWTNFAGFLLVLQGVFQVILGLTALLNDKFFAAAQGNLLVWSYSTWGWIHLLFGVLVLVVGTSVFNGGTWARAVGTVLAAANLVLQFVFVSAYPTWSIILMILDLVILYALTVRSDGGADV